MITPEMKEQWLNQAARLRPSVLARGVLAKGAPIALCGLLVLGIGLAACRSGGGPLAGPSYMLFSPNGEPLNGGKLGRPNCATAMSRWFQRADANHDGVLSWKEFAIDARRQFLRMDLDHDGYIAPDELSRFRQPFVIPTGNGRREQMDESEAPIDNSPWKVSQADRGLSGNSGDAAEPVMSADTDNDNRVSYKEFMAQAGQTFTTLDAANNNLLTREEVVKSCSSGG